MGSVYSYQDFLDNLDYNLGLSYQHSDNSDYSGTSRQYGYGYSGYGSTCCERKVDPLTLLAVIGAIAALSWFMRQAVIDNMIAAGRKRSTGIFDFVSQGNILICNLFLKSRLYNHA